VSPPDHGRKMQRRTGRRRNGRSAMRRLSDGRRVVPWAINARNRNAADYGHGLVGPDSQKDVVRNIIPSWRILPNNPDAGEPYCLPV